MWAPQWVSFLIKLLVVSTTHFQCWWQAMVIVLWNSYTGSGHVLNLYALLFASYIQLLGSIRVIWFSTLNNVSARPCVCPSVCLSVVENLSPEGVFDKRVDIRLKPGVDGVEGGILDQTLGKLEWHQKKINNTSHERSQCVQYFLLSSGQVWWIPANIYQQTEPDFPRKSSDQSGKLVPADCGQN